MVNNHRFSYFSNETTFHGFKELYTAKRWPIRLGWALVFVACTGMCSYQIYQSIDQYINQPISTSVRPLNAPYPLPKIKFVVPDFLWIDPDRQFNAGIDNEMLVYIKSLMSGSVYWFGKPFDMNETEEAYQKLVITNGYKSFKQVLDAIAFIDPPGIDAYVYSGSWLLTAYLDSNALYELEQNKQQIPIVDDVEWEVNDDLSTSYGVNFTRLYERGAEIRRQQELNNTEYPNITDYYSFSTPPHVYMYTSPKYYESSLFQPFNQQDYILLEPGLSYVITYTIQLYIPLNIIKKGTASVGGCYRSKNNDLSYTVNLCVINCISSNEKQKFLIDGRCQWQQFMIDEIQQYPNKFCSYGILFNLTDSMSFWTDSEWQLFWLFQEDAKNNTIKCRKLCQPICQQWTVRSTVSSKSDRWDKERNVSSVHVSFPDESTVLVMEEFTAKTWESFVSDIGGLLGLWLGASMMSFFQLIYICGCPSGGDSGPVDVGPHSSNRKAWFRRTTNNQQTEEIQQRIFKISLKNCPDKNANRIVVQRAPAIPV